jgi:hypothetical protein
LSAQATLWVRGRSLDTVRVTLLRASLSDITTISGLEPLVMNRIDLRKVVIELVSREFGQLFSQ